VNTDPPPKFEFHDPCHTMAVVAGHDFEPKDDDACSNLVRCARCGLDGWVAWEGPVGARRIVVQSYHPKQPCLPV
jgi:hypothetical protein